MKTFLCHLWMLAILASWNGFAGESSSDKTTTNDIHVASALEGKWYCVSNAMLWGYSTINFKTNGVFIETTIHERKTGDRFLCTWKTLNKTIQIANWRWFRREEWPLADAFWPKQLEWRILRLDDTSLVVEVPVYGEQRQRLYVREKHLPEYGRTVAEFAGDAGKLKVIWDNTEKPNQVPENTARKLADPQH